MPRQKTEKPGISKRIFNWANAPCQSSSFVICNLHSLLRIILITVKEFQINSLNIRASALTYTILLSLVPILAMSTAVVKGLGGGDELRQLVYSYIETLEETTPLTNATIPGLLKNGESLPSSTRTDAEENAPVTAHFRSAADQIFDYVENTNFATLGTIGVLGILLSAVLVLSNIELSMNTIWHVPAGRSLLRKVTDYLSFLILMPISINFGFAANAVLKNDTLLTKFLNLLPGPLVQTGLLFLIPLFFITLTLFLIYIFFPNTKVQPGAAFIGALFAGTLWFATQNIYVGLQIGVSRYNAIYGSFATLPLFLIWMFLGWVFILGGAQLAFACQRHKSYQLKALSHTPLEQFSCAIDILDAVYTQFANKGKISKAELPAHCPAYPSTTLFHTLKKLTDSQIINCTEKGHLLPTAPSAVLSFQDIAASIFGNSFPDTPGGKQASDLFHKSSNILEKNFSIASDNSS